MLVCKKKSQIIKDKLRPQPNISHLIIKDNKVDLKDLSKPNLNQFDLIKKINNLNSSKAIAIDMEKNRI